MNVLFLPDFNFCYSEWLPIFFNATILEMPTIYSLEITTFKSSTQSKYTSFVYDSKKKKKTAFLNDQNSLLFISNSLAKRFYSSLFFPEIVFLLSYIYVYHMNITILLL